MEMFARYALFGCVLASGLGGIAVCVVGFKYGLVPPAEDDPIELTHRRLFVTHFAHAFAVVAFALTAMLGGTVLMLDRGAAPITDAQRKEVQARPAAARRRGSARQADDRDARADDSPFRQRRGHRTPPLIRPGACSPKTA